MCEQYERLAVAPDPARAEALRERLHAQLRGASQKAEVEVDDRDEARVVAYYAADPSTPIAGRRLGRESRRRRVAAAAVFALGAVGIAAAVSASSRDRGHEAVGTPPASGPSVSSSEVQGLAAVPDDASIAEATLLTRSEYGPGWRDIGFNLVVELDATIAGTIPACEPFVDSLFESASRDAVVTYRWSNAPRPNVAAMSQYVVVFADEAAAIAMLDARRDPAVDECLDEYEAAVPASVFSPVRRSELAPPPLDLAGDDVFVARTAGPFTDSAGVERSEDVLSAMVRVGRIVTILEAADPSFYPYEQFEAAVATMVERARAALRGEPWPPTTAAP